MAATPERRDQRDRIGALLESGGDSVVLGGYIDDTTNRTVQDGIDDGTLTGVELVGGPVVGVAAILKTIFALKVFDQVYLITNGGPGNSTQTLAHFIYYQAMRYSDMGYASALSYLLVLPLGILVVIYTRAVFRR